MFDYIATGNEGIVCQAIDEFSQTCNDVLNLLLELNSETFCRKSSTVNVVIIECPKYSESFRNYICYMIFSVLCVNKY